MAVPVKHTHIYRHVLREVSKSTKSPRGLRNKAIPSSFREIIAKVRQDDKVKALFNHDMQNVITFLRSQREHKKLIERYNPLIDLTKEERIHATARRVGLDMPVLHRPEEKE